MTIKLPQQVEHLAIDALLPYARNSRTHSDAQVGQLAASIREFGFTNPVLVDEAGGIIAGHGRVMAARALGLAQVPCLRLTHLTDAQKRAYVIADNKLALNAGWDDQMLRLELQELHAADFDLSLVGFTGDELDDLLRIDLEEGAPATGLTDADQVPAVAVTEVSCRGDVWRLGPHRVMCGDSTDAAAVERLMAGQRAVLLHADPPYGMGKECDGVANDNLRGVKLDAFQLAWWRAFRPHLEDNASAYIWGNAPDLWRLWYASGLAQSERFELRNEIVWDKKAIPGMASPGLTQYPEASERCLFFQFGDQFIGNVNTADFPETWQPLRAYMAGEAEAAGIGPADVKRVCGCGMYSHWFTRSQFYLIAEPHYASLQAAYPGRFARPWVELKAEWEAARAEARQFIQSKQGIAQSYFDNAHSPMRDVWEFPRVLGNDRHGHATPKPVAMMERAVRSSAAPGGLVVEPFGGSGSTLMGAHVAGRVCFAMELQPVYVDVIVRRWQDYTGQLATLESSGQTFAAVAAVRARQAA